MQRVVPLVVVIDSIPQVARDICHELSKVVRCETLVVENAWDAVTLVLSAKPRVALIDTDPAIDGVEVARSIRDRMDGQSPVLIGMAREADVMRLAQANVFDHVLVKPIDLRTLVALLVALPRVQVGQRLGQAPQT